MATTLTNKQSQGASSGSTTTAARDASARLQEMLAASLAVTFLTSFTSKISTGDIPDVSEDGVLIALIVADMHLLGILRDAKSVKYFYEGLLLPKMLMTTEPAWGAIVNPFAELAIKYAQFLTEQNLAANQQKLAGEGTLH